MKLLRQNPASSNIYQEIIKNMIRFITYSEAEKLPEHPTIGGLGGFFQLGMRWTDYLEQCAPPIDSEGALDLEILRKTIIKQHIKCTGREHQSDIEPYVPLFEDGTVATFSYRAWGDLMAAVWSSEEEKDYCYMDFYC